MKPLPGLLSVLFLVTLCFVWQHLDWFPAYRRMQAHEQVNADLVQAVERSDVSGVQHAFARGADLSSVYSSNKYESDAVEDTNPGVLLILMQHGLDINKPLSDGGTLLIDAAGNRGVDSVKFLLAHGVDIQSQGGDALRAAADSMADRVKMGIWNSPGNFSDTPAEEEREIADTKRPFQTIIRMLKAAGATWTLPKPTPPSPYHTAYPVNTQTPP